jgi:hypothetical protein
MPLGSVGYESEIAVNGEWLIWAERIPLDKLTRLRRPGDSYSEVILRLVEIEAAKRGRNRAMPSA